MRDFTLDMAAYGGAGGVELGGIDTDGPLTHIVLTPNGCAMGPLDYDYAQGVDAVRATRWANHKAPRVYAAGRP